jgi:hypothetical protein
MQEVDGSRINVSEEQRAPDTHHVPFNVVGKCAQEDLGAYTVLEPITDGASFVPGMAFMLLAGFCCYAAKPHRAAMPK